MSFEDRKKKKKKKKKEERKKERKKERRKEGREKTTSKKDKGSRKRIHIHKIQKTKRRPFNGSFNGNLTKSDISRKLTAIQVEKINCIIN